MAIEHKAPLTSSEIGILWIQYMGDTMALCLEKFHVAKEQDSQVRAIYQDAVSLMEKTTAQIRQIFQNECIPLTQGFTDADVNLEAPPLYSGIYRLQYFKYEMNLRLMANGLCMGESSRADVRNFYRNLSIAIMDLDDRATNLLLEKGLYIRAPFITVSERLELVRGQNFMKTFFGSGERKLLASEIGTLFCNIRNNVMGKILLTGFSQVAESAEVREFMSRGVEIAKKHVQIYSTILYEEDIPIPMSSNSDVTDSTVAPFSDKLMLYHGVLLNQVGFAAYGTSISISMRKDLQTLYTRLVAKSVNMLLTEPIY